MGVGRVTERGFLCSETAFFLCRTDLASHALQAKRLEASQPDTRKLGE